MTNQAGDHAGEAFRRIADAYPEARVELTFRNPLELLVATILSAQCTDKRVNQITKTLFLNYPNVAAYATANLEELEEAVRPSGFFRQKAKNIKACCVDIVKRHNGVVPSGMEELTSLAGVGRKTASVLLAIAFDTPAIAVDTHCRRVSQRLGLTTENNPEKVEHDLQELYAKELWADITRLFIWHGRYTCKSRNPRCQECMLPDMCPWYLDMIA
ncbi:MAG: endonuclease III [Acidobacteriota bacterium]|nr:endonuclease III [Acidobacteriota bacterium]